MADFITKRLMQMVANAKATVEDLKVKKAERQRVKALTKELINTVKNPDENAAQTIKDLVAQGADVNTFDMDKERSLLHFAAEQNRMDVVKALVESGCKRYINVNDMYGKDPAFYAIDNNNPEMLDYLLANGVSTNRPADFNLVSSLRYAVRLGRVDLAAIELKHGANVDDHVGEGFKLYDKYEKVYPGPTPLADVVGGQEINTGAEIGKKYDMAMIEFLLENGARTDLADSYGKDLQYIESLPIVQQMRANKGKKSDISGVAMVRAKAKSIEK